VLASVDLAEVADRPAKTYSGGMVRRLELAQALVSAPKLLVLDEPTVGLDPVARDGVWARIEQIQRDTGMTVLMTTHLMQEADQRCDRVALMHRGRIRALGTPAELRGTLGKDATLDDVFRAYTGDRLAENSGAMRDVRAARRTARRVS
jgi:ABC-2 type transport system ATP-binding protein